MKVYRLIIRADKYPTEYTVEANKIETAIFRGVREWKKKFKGTKVSEMSIKVIVGGQLLHENDEE